MVSNCLTGRRQCIVYDFDNITSYNGIRCGLLQGCILDPLLFLIHINDFFKSSSNLTPVMFADDSNLFLSGKKIETLFQSTKTELEKAIVLFKANKPSFKSFRN